MQQTRQRFWTRVTLLLMTICLSHGAWRGIVPLSRAAPASQPEPYQPWGSVHIDGSPAPDGTVVTGSVTGASVEDTTCGGYYELSIPGDDPATPEDEGGEEGEIVTFTVDGWATSSSGSWYPGRSERIDLSITLSVWYRDADGDGFGDPSLTQQAPSAPEGYVADGTDCDDQDPNEFPGQTWNRDGDGDGYGDGSSLVQCERPEDHYTSGELTAITGDCDDTDANVNPDASEICNGIDDDCDTLVDDDDPSCTGQPIWYLDADGDGYGDADSSQLACSQPSGYASNDQDCNDADGAINPGADEICDGVDNNCNGLIDEGFTDSDGDGEADCVDADDDGDGVEDSEDCAPQDGARWQELPGFSDGDGDGFGTGPEAQICSGPSLPTGYAENDGDCDDSDPNVNPDASEICNGIDDDCDELVDDEDPTCAGRPTWYLDTDGDGYGDPDGSLLACTQPSGYASNDQDCNDADEAINPGAEEICDGVDNNCDESVDEGFADSDGDGGADCVDPDDDDDGTDDTEDCDPLDSAVWQWMSGFADNDGDGFGTGSEQQVCAGETLPPGSADVTGDCDDTDPNVNPDASEICNGIDDDCDTLIDTEDPDCSAPLADAGGPYGGNRAESIALDGGASLDADGTVQSYQWLVAGLTVYSGTNATYALDLGDYALSAHAVQLMVTDDSGCMDQDGTTLEVTNATPVAVDDSSSTPEDVPVSVFILENDSDPDGTLEPTTVMITDPPTDGSVVLNPFGVATYTPDAAFNGLDVFSYTVRDNDGATSNPAAVTVAVGEVNYPPVAEDDEATTMEDTAVVIEVLSNDGDPDGSVDQTTVRVVGEPLSGSVQVASTGVATYAPALDFFGVDVFTYTVQDDGGATSNEAVVTIVVQEVNDPPVAVVDAASTDRETPVGIDVLENDYDVDGSLDPATIEIGEPPTAGSVVVGASGIVTYTPEAGYVGPDLFSYSVRDDDGARSMEAAVEVGVSAPDSDDRIVYLPIVVLGRGSALQRGIVPVPPQRQGTPGF